MNNVKFCRVSWKCCYYIIIALIIVYVFSPVIIGIVNITLSVENSHGWEFRIKTMIAVIWSLTDLSLNTLLTVLYIRGLHEFAIQKYFNPSTVNDQYLKERARSNYCHKCLYSLCFDRLKYHKQYGDVKLLDDRQHELMLEATRFTVLYVFTWILNFVALLIFIGIYLLYTLWYDPNHIDGTGITFENIKYMSIILGIYFKEIASLTAINLSWVFSHSKYEKICGKCDSFTKECCESLVRRSNHRVAREINIPLVQSLNDNNTLQLGQPLLSEPQLPDK